MTLKLRENLTFHEELVRLEKIYNKLFNDNRTLFDTEFYYYVNSFLFSKQDEIVKGIILRYVKNHIYLGERFVISCIPSGIIFTIKNSENHFELMIMGNSVLLNFPYAKKYSKDSFGEVLKTCNNEVALELYKILWP